MRDSLLFDPRESRPRAGVARAWSAVVVLGLLVACTWRWAPGGEGHGSIALEQRPDTLGRLERRLNEQHPSVQHRSGADFRRWHEEHAPKESSSFSVMHVVPLPGKKDEAASTPVGGAAQGTQGTAPAADNALMSHADKMLRADNNQLNAENKQFENSKPKGLSNAIETNKEKGEDLDKQAVDHQIKGQYRSQEAQREESKSELEAKRGDIAEALAHEYQSKIEEHKRELVEEKRRMTEEKDERTAESIKGQAEQDKDKALDDARLAGRLDDKADESRAKQRQVKDQERQSQLQLKQLNDEVRRAEGEAKRARADAHALRVTAASDAHDAKGQLAKAEVLMKHSAHQRMEARTKKGEIQEAQVALTTASNVEKKLTIRAAQYTGQGKLDVLQSKLLKKAAAQHNVQAKAWRHKAEKRSEVIEQLQEAEEKAENQEHKADVKVRRLHDRLDLDKRRARRRLERARALEDKAQEAYKADKAKYQLESE